MSVCPSCAQAIVGELRACAWCNVPFKLDAQGAAVADLPAIGDGIPIVARDFADAPLPSLDKRDAKLDETDSVEGTRHGVQLTMPNGTRWFAVPRLRVRDVCVRLVFDALDPDLRILVIARRQTIGAARVWYEVGISPHDRGVRIARMFTAAGVVELTALHGPAPHQAVAPTGATNELELRTQGNVIEAHVNGARVAACHDAVLGIGAVAIGACVIPSDKRPRRALFRSFEVRAVAP